jgi:cytochrome c peroxidase
MGPIAALSLALVCVLSFRSMQSTYDWHLPPGFPTPSVPADNPISAQKVELGRHLFYDTRLSVNGTQSCATCHQQRHAFTDNRMVSVGATGERHPRSSMSLANAAYAATLTWGNPSLTALEDQALVPMFGEHPAELGLPTDDRWIEPLRRDARYQALFQSAYPTTSEPMARRHVLQAIASFERTLISGRSPYDRYHYDRQEDAVTEAAKRGEVLFHSGPFSCFTCHGGFNFSGATRSAGLAVVREEFHNTGLYNLIGALSYPAPNTGIYEVTGKPADVGKFKAPTLRNIAVTAPYMHDGSVATLQEAIRHYAAGGRTIVGGPHAGIGRDNFNKSQRIRGFDITPAQTADLIAFLEALTDEAFLQDERFADPFQSGPR